MIVYVVILIIVDCFLHCLLTSAAVVVMRLVVFIQCLYCLCYVFYLSSSLTVGCLIFSTHPSHWYVFHSFQPLFSCLLSHLSCVLCTQYAQPRSLLFSSVPSFSHTLHFVCRYCSHFANHFECTWFFSCCVLFLSFYSRCHCDCWFWRWF